MKSSRQRIVMLGPHFDSQGGMASVINSYRENGLFDKWPVCFLPTYVEGTLFQKLRIAFSSMNKLILMIALNKVAALHVHVARRGSIWRKTVFMAIAYVSRIPFIQHLHSGGFHDYYARQCGPVGQSIIRFFLNRAHCLIVLSPQWLAYLNGLTTNPDIRMIPNFVCVPEFRGQEDRELFTLLFLGKLTHEKGIYDLIQAVSIIKDDFPALRLELCGNGDEKPVLEMISRLDLHDRIQLNGWVSGSKKNELLRKATLFVLPSYYEGIPIGVLEAMAVGLPVIASDVGGLPEVVESGVEGLLVQPGDVRGLADAMKRLLSQPEQRLKMGDAGRLKVHNQFSKPVVFKKLDTVYEDLGILPAHAAVEEKRGVS